MCRLLHVWVLCMELKYLTAFKGRQFVLQGNVVLLHPHEAAYLCRSVLNLAFAFTFRSDSSCFQESKLPQLLESFFFVLCPDAESTQLFKPFVIPVVEFYRIFNIIVVEILKYTKNNSKRRE